MKIVGIVFTVLISFGLFEAYREKHNPNAIVEQAKYEAQSFANAKAEADQKAAADAQQAKADTDQKAWSDRLGRCMGSASLDLPGYAYDQMLHYCQNRADYGTDETPQVNTAEYQAGLDKLDREIKARYDKGEEAEAAKASPPTHPNAESDPASEVQQDAAAMSNTAS